MKKINFKKRVSQLMAGVFGLVLMGGVMLSSASLEAQTSSSSKKTKANFDGPINNICKQPGTDCEAPVIVTTPKPKPDTQEISAGN